VRPPASNLDEWLIAHERVYEEALGHA
jgi:hypothetical protein